MLRAPKSGINSLCRGTRCQQKCIHTHLPPPAPSHPPKAWFPSSCPQEQGTTCRPPRFPAPHPCSPHLHSNLAPRTRKDGRHTDIPQHPRAVQQCLAAQQQPPALFAPARHSREQSPYLARDRDDIRPRLGGDSPYPLGVWPCLHTCIPRALYPHYAGFRAEDFGEPVPAAGIHIPSHSTLLAQSVGGRRGHAAFSCSLQLPLHFSWHHKVGTNAELLKLKDHAHGVSLNYN